MTRRVDAPRVLRAVRDEFGYGPDVVNCPEGIEVYLVVGAPREQFGRAPGVVRDEQAGKLALDRILDLTSVVARRGVHVARAVCGTVLPEPLEPGSAGYAKLEEVRVRGGRDINVHRNGWGGRDVDVYRTVREALALHSLEPTLSDPLVPFSMAKSALRPVRTDIPRDETKISFFLKKLKKK